MTFLLLVVVGFAAGILSALLGVGGGVLIVPFLVIVLDEPQVLAQGTSLVVIIPTAIAGLLAHRKRNPLQARIVGGLGAGGVVGVALGVALAVQLESGTLRTIFAALMAVVGIRMVFNGITALRREEA